MYLEHFNLAGAPFKPTPDPDFLYMTRRHSRVKACMDHCVQNHEGLVVVTGAVGSGKTTLVRALLSELPENVLVARIFQSQLDDVQLLKALLLEFQVEIPEGGKAELLDQLNGFLIDSYTRSFRPLVIIDDAQRLSKSALHELMLLCSLETDKEKILQIVLVGQPELDRQIDEPEMAGLRQRIRFRRFLGPLSAEDIEPYISHRMLTAGSAGRTIFRPDTYSMIYSISGGLPRVINTLCDTALICAYADGLDEITRDVIHDAVEELDWDKLETLDITLNETEFARNRDSL